MPGGANVGEVPVRPKLAYQPKIEPYNPKGSLTFDEYIERWELYFDDVGLDDPMRQKSMFVNYQGDESFALISRLCLPEKVKTVTFDKLKEKMMAYFQQSEPSKMVFKDKFNQRVQGKNEPAIEFVTDLTRLANKCCFKERDEQLLARIISGMRNSALKEKLLTEDDTKLKIEDVVNRIYAAERAAVAAKDLSEAAAIEVNKIFAQNKISPKGKASVQKKGQRSFDYNCFACGEKGHRKADCRFKNAECYTCGKKGHTTKACHQAKKSQKVEAHTTWKIRLRRLKPWRRSVR